ncbi:MULTISPECIES: ABC transporter ATP-binding protein [Clostridium]|uniref:ABC-type antimicrobial peptide transport system, ATPase component n=2 Tax=Clostridium TaxID=1485 RepID=M1MQW3_9CLOT|nr:MULTISPECIES: ABC transporter ATP-binding protein [Clostridium]AGF57141.1 ABC-type antimicrobial peptide transport system, ATPase component [Clostridium saccharoperbutylacetonicum N1-4(HMT)]MBC2478091.1 ABC transporter ATP-binding protein [Clostridium beijerinckii]NRT62100.1 putative ABC transport system ATP-binding protein [Clostridium saccharoperbutylacetonicum]NSB25430.1 putative ABC transport system ATP-binding protein [Clostridium saccharoperbutylacetonicum]NSB44799.1 putative ABC tran
MSKNVIDMKNITKSFYIGTPNQLNILKGIDITVKEGEFVSIIGSSGSGKSTLMNIIGALDRATSGEYVLDGTNINEISDDGLSEVRNKQIGFVFQTYNLMPRSTALSNVELPLLYYGMNRKQRRERAEELLDLVGMKDRMAHRPNELSGGQKQRVAIARALATNPSIILADEPTGALDSATGRMVMDLFHKVHEQEGKTIVFITHNNELADETQRIITLKDGNIISTMENSNYYRRYQEEEKICL